MIYGLVKRGVEWKIAVGFAAAYALVAFLGTGQVALFMATLFYLIVLFMNQKRCTLFEAALPLPARDLFCARMVSSAALIWLPILSGIVSFTLRGAARWQDATLFVEIGIILSFGVVVVQSMDITQFDVPLWWKAAVALGTLSSVIYTDTKIESPAIVVTICVLGGGALLLKTWAAIPETFQLAPERAVSGGLQTRRIPLPTVWAPVLRSISSKFLAFFLLVLIQDPSRDPILTGWVAGVLALVSMGAVRKAEWLLALPVSRWKLFIAGLFPIALCLSGPFMFSDFYKQPSRFQLIILLAAAATALLGTLVCSLFFLPRFRRPAVHSIILVLILGVPSVDLYFQPGYGGPHAPNLFVAWLSRVLPANPLLLLSAGVAVIAGLCWLAYAFFSEMEALNRKQPGQA